MLTVLNGYAEVLPDRVIILAEALSARRKLTYSARARLQIAQAELAKATGAPETDWERAAAALQRALVRVEAASKR